MIRISIYLDVPEEEDIDNETISVIMEAAVEGLDDRGFVVEGIIGQKVNVYIGKIDDDVIEINETPYDNGCVASWGDEVYDD